MLDVAARGCVGLYAGHTGEPCKHGWTDREPVWGAKNIVLDADWDPAIHVKEEAFEGDMRRLTVGILQCAVPPV